MAVLVSRAQLDGLKAALDKVRSNAQALAAIDASLSSADRLAGVLRSDGGTMRAGAIRDIESQAKPVEQLRKSFSGSGTMAVGASWVQARPKIQQLWIMLFLLETGLPPGQELGDTWRDALASAAADLPKTIGNAAGVVLKTAVKAVVQVAKTAGEISGSLVWSFLKASWPVVAIAVLAGVGYWQLKKRGLL
jgi:hypothetical protein